MTEKQIKQISKFLSLVLRHKPQILDLNLDKNGWDVVDVLLERLDRESKTISFEELKKVVEMNDKKRFSFNEDKTKIRANQGHSLGGIDLELKVKSPPEFLYHGTVAKFMKSIKEKGLQKMNRQHVHLSKDRETANNVGSRRGKPIILSIRAKDMEYSGYKFYLSENNVWLTDRVPTEFIEFK